MARTWKRDLGAAAVIAGFYAALFRLGITCPIKYLTGLSCPGCGMTRAWLALLRLDLAAAWAYHPLFWLPPAALALWLFRDRLPRRVVKYAPAAVGALVFAVYFLRLFGGCEPEVVAWVPEEGLLWRLGAKVLGAV